MGTLESKDNSQPTKGPITQEKDSPKDLDSEKSLPCVGLDEFTHFKLSLPDQLRKISIKSASRNLFENTVASP
jgi:hypothetical protein